MNFTRVVQRSVFRSPKPAMRVRFFPCVLDLVPKWPKGTVCKTVIHGFKSHPDLLYGVSSVKVTLLIVDQSFRVRVSGYSLYLWSAGATVSTSDFLSENISSILVQTIMERWQSGRMRQHAKLLQEKSYRGFKSLPLRNLSFPANIYSV